MRKAKNSPYVLRKLDSHLQKKLNAQKQIHSLQGVKVIVLLNAKPCNRMMIKLDRHMGKRRMTSYKKLHVIRAIHTQIPFSSLARLCQCGAVRKILTDRKKQTHLRFATPTIGATSAQQSGWTGKNIGIAVLDTGVYAHPDLIKPNNRIRAFKDYVNFKKKPYDDNGHGTHCAGDAAGNGFMSKGKYIAPAPDAHIIGVKVLDKKGKGYDSTIIRGIQWCIQNKEKYRIRILSLSLGGKAELTYRQDPVCLAIRQATRAGIIVVTSAGNSGPRSKTIETPGISPESITVGSTNDRNQVDASKNKVAKYSSRGPTNDGLSKPDLVAPGTNITSLVAPQSYLAKKKKKQHVGKWYMRMSGTSMSTPIVAGAIAQILQKEPTLSSKQVKLRLQAEAINLGTYTNTQGSGLMNNLFLV